MTTHGIWTTDDKKELKLLRKKVASFDFNKYSKKDLESLLKKMRVAMKKAAGIGLSANQFGLDANFFIAELSGKFYAVFNPKITKASGASVMEEGCLSVPGFFGEVSRSEKVILEGLDKNQKPIKIKAWGLLARIFQHEVDHLNGALFIDKAKEVKKYDEGTKIGNKK